jgi:CheY-like chemotaxis protein
MNETILIVDDDEFMRASMQETLEQGGYLTETAEDGLIALEMLRANPSRYDLILLDKRMPRLDGIGLLTRLKFDERLKHLPVIMLTGANQQSDIVEGLAAGAFYYLMKPPAENVLKQVIRNTLDEFRTKRELHETLSHQNNNLRLLQRAEFSFRTLQEARKIALFLADASQHPERTLNGYAEILINAVEHGNLGITYAEKGQLMRDGLLEEEITSRLQNPLYADRCVKVLFEKSATDSVVTVTDQGNGFDWQDYLDFRADRMFDLHGRGIALSRIMCFNKLEFFGNGNIAVITVNTVAAK